MKRSYTSTLEISPSFAFPRMNSRWLLEFESPTICEFGNFCDRSITNIHANRGHLPLPDIASSYPSHNPSQVHPVHLSFSPSHNKAPSSSLPLEKSALSHFQTNNTNTSPMGPCTCSQWKRVALHNAARSRIPVAPRFLGRGCVKLRWTHSWQQSAVQGCLRMLHVALSGERGKGASQQLGQEHLVSIPSLYI